MIREAPTFYLKENISGTAGLRRMESVPVQSTNMIALTSDTPLILPSILFWVLRVAQYANLSTVYRL